MGEDSGHQLGGATEANKDPVRRKEDVVCGGGWGVEYAGGVRISALHHDCPGRSDAESEVTNSTLPYSDHSLKLQPRVAERIWERKTLILTDTEGKVIGFFFNL